MTENKCHFVTVLLCQVRSRGLPDDHVGPVRVVDIKGIDSNLCCGTHVSNLSDLQVCSCRWAASGSHTPHGTQPKSLGSTGCSRLS